MLHVVFFFFLVFFSLLPLLLLRVLLLRHNEQPGGTSQGDVCEKVDHTEKSGWFSDVPSSALPSSPSPALKAAGGLLEVGVGAEHQYERDVRIC